MNKKVNDTNVNVNDNAGNNESSITVEAPEPENIFHWTEEHDCYKGQYMDSENRFQFERWPPVEETCWDNFRARCIDTKTGRWFTNGDGQGRCLGKEGPRRIVSALIRLKTSNGAEYLLSNSMIIGYSAYGDRQTTPASQPEKYYKTIFRFEVTPNYDTGFSERRNTGPSGGSLIYTLPFTKENAQKLFDMRENEKIQFIVKSDEGQAIGVKPQITVNDTFKLFVENDFEYLYHANYIPQTQKLLNAKQAENEGLIPKMTDDERTASILAQQALSQKDKMVSYG